MGLLEQQQGLLPATANPKMLAQALKARQQPRTQLNGQGLLDTAAIGLSPIPVIGDALGLAADANRFVNEPESRTPLNFGLAALGLIPFVPPLVSAGLGKFAQSQGKTLAQAPTGPARNQAGAIVYHGSPHKFDQFDSSKIGTGEGAQAYGHGLYFAENPSVAKGYRNVLSDTLEVKGDALPLEKRVAQMALTFGDNTSDGALKWLSKFADKGANHTSPAMTPELIKSVSDKFKNGTFLQGGSLYKVDLPDEAIAKMLDYDAPVKDQPNVLKAIRDRLPQDMLGAFDTNVKSGISGANAYKNWLWDGGKTDASKAESLRQLGIPGIRYLDGGSRGAGNGTSNFVVFPGNEGLLKILERQ